MLQHLYKHFHQKCNTNVSENYLNTTVHQFKAMNPFIQCLHNYTIIFLF